MSNAFLPRRIGRVRLVAALLLLLMIAAGLALWWSNALGFTPTPAGIEAEIRSWGAWAAVGSVLLMVAHNFIPFPAEFITFANGMLFGPALGVAVTWIGAMLGASLAFALSRWCGRPVIDALMNERQRAAVDRWAMRQGTGVLLASRLMPLISFNVINFAAGLTPVSWWTFLWTTGLGILPITTLLVITGDQVWNGRGHAWIYLIAVAAAGVFIWWYVTRSRER